MRHYGNQLSTIKQSHRWRGKFPPARAPAVGVYEGQHLALLATPGPGTRDRCMAERMPSLHKSEMGLRAEAARAERDRSTLASHLSIRPADLSQSLLVAVERAASKDADSMVALRLVVRSFTDTLKDAGTTPERVLIILKALIHKRSPLVSTPHASDWTGQLREKISTWCIEDYFREKTA
jgi:hypothetical protein